jgi:hypothetical protein
VPINRRLLAAMVCGAFVLSGCTPTPVPAAEDKQTAVASLGELRTVDYCSLVDTAKLAGSGTIAKPPHKGFDSCRVEMTEQDLVTAVEVGPLESGKNSRMQALDYQGAPLPEGASVRDSTFFPEQSCTRYLVFGDGVRLAVSAQDDRASDPGIPKEPLRVAWCAKADLAVAQVVAAITEKRVAQTSYDKNSFGALDPCALLKGPEADALIGADKEIEPVPHGHRCKRGDAMLDFNVPVPHPDQTADPYPPKSEVIAGRPALIYGTMGGCMIAVDRVETGESLVVQWLLSKEHLDSCEPGRALAELVLPKLP